MKPIKLTDEQMDAALGLGPNTTLSKAQLAYEANRLASMSRNPGAPMLWERSARDVVCAWLQWNDPDGCHTDALALAEGCDPYTDETAWEALATVIADN